MKKFAVSVSLILILFFTLLSGDICLQTVPLEKPQLPDVLHTFQSARVDSYLRSPELPEITTKQIEWKPPVFLESPKLPIVETKQIEAYRGLSLTLPKLFDVGRHEIQPHRTSVLTSPQLPDVATYQIRAHSDSTLSFPNLPEPEKREIQRYKVPLLTSPSLPAIPPTVIDPAQKYLLAGLNLPNTDKRNYQIPEQLSLNRPTLPDVGLNEVYGFKDFRGGWNTETHKAKLEPNEAIDLENARWKRTGELGMRGGYSLHSATPEGFNLVYRFYRQAGDKYRMAGSDTALYYAAEDSSVWHHLIGTQGTSGRWDASTYEDLLVATHEGIEPVVFNGDSILTILQQIVVQDSFKIENVLGFAAPGDTTVCAPGSLILVFDNPGWDAHQWQDYTIAYRTFSEGVVRDNFLTYNQIIDNTADQLFIRVWSNCNLLFDGDHVWIIPLFGVHEVWREGLMDSVAFCDHYGYTRIIDRSYAWDSTFNYRDYIFEVTEGTGTGAKVWLMNQDCYPCPWDTSGFIVQAYNQHCFAESSRYRIYKPAFLGEGAKFVENFDGRLWFAWTGLPERIISTDEVLDSSYAGQDTIIESIDTSIVSIDTSGCDVDSFLFRDNYQFSGDDPCPHCSTWLFFPTPGWSVGQLDGSAMLIPVWVYSDTSPFVRDTLTRYVHVDHNNIVYWTFGRVYCVFSSSPCAEGEILYSALPLPYYAKFYSIDTTGTLWREGSIDSATAIGGEGTWLKNCHTRLWDEDYKWDDTVSYNYYYFIVDAGKGQGIKTFLFNYVPCPGCNVDWDTSAFLLPNYQSDCFDATTHYKIYTPSLSNILFCDVETTFSFDTTFSYHILWNYFYRDVLDTLEDLTNQEKNVIIYSEVGSLNFPSENRIILESDDGDFITGMGVFPSQFMDVPSYEMMVSKNNSVYKIVPGFDLTGKYDPDFYLISDGVGCVSNSAISGAEGKYLIWPDQHGVWAYDRNKLQNISLQIAAVFRGWHREQLERASAIYNPQDRHYYLSYPDTATPEDTSVYCMVSWEDNRDGYWGVYGQKFNYNIGKIDTNFRVDDDITDSHQSAPDVCIDGQQRWIFVWDDERIGEGLGSIRMRRFDTQGTPLDTSVLVNDNGTYDRGMPHVDANQDGKVIVVWEDCRNAQYTPDIYGQWYDSAGTAIGSNFLVDTCTAGCYEPHVEIADDGKFVITWIVLRNHYFQRYDAGGNTVGANTSCLDSTPEYVGTYADIAMNETNGDFVMTWSMEINPLTDYNIWAQRFDSAGSALGNNFMVNDDASEKTNERPSTAMNSNSEFIVAMDDWREYDEIHFGDVWCQRYINGSAVGSNFKVSNSDTSDCKKNACDIDDYGDFVVVWTNYEDTTNTYLKAFSWNGAARSGIVRVNDRRVQVTEENAVAINPYLVRKSTTNNKTLAWSIDFGGWSKESFDAACYCYQHSVFDSVKILFADAGKDSLYYYDTQDQDIDQSVILTYQSPYFSFTSHPYFDNYMRFATFAGYLDTGTVYLDFYKDYSDLTFQDSIICGGDCRREIQLPDSLKGKNISTKIRTGPDATGFTLLNLWLEYSQAKERE